MKKTKEGILSKKGFGIQYVDTNSVVADLAVEATKKYKPKNILDVGAGRGIVSLRLLKEFSGLKILATDIDEEGLKEITAKSKGKIKTRVVDIGVLHPEFDNKFDFVVAKDVYPFLKQEQVRNMMVNLSRALKQNGMLILTAPSTFSKLFQDASKTNKHQLFYQKLGNVAKEFIPTTRSHFSFADIGLLDKQLKSVGLTMRKASHYGKAEGWITILAQKTMPKRF
ncbi:class I SAM-dependent methyltransferase [Candidatus Woesearchaeota archaeon]|nr:class I SAM-dependent methyltransferase [Candidatus Woesearchaeota archaeon]